MIETLLITGLVTGAAFASGLPQSFYKKHKSKFKDAGIWAAGKWHKFSKLMGFSNPKRLLNFEKTKLEHAIERLIEVIANYEAMVVDLNYQIKKYSDNPRLQDAVAEMVETRENITDKLEMAKLQLQERRDNLRELIQFINESTTDEKLFKLDPTSKDNQKFLKHQADVENVKKKKDV